MAGVKCFDFKGQIVIKTIFGKNTGPQNFFGEIYRPNFSAGNLQMQFQRFVKFGMKIEKIEAKTHLT